jgi:8-oxo-dGTP diphosphatase
LEFGESFEETSEREVFEETGIKIKNIRFGAITNDILLADGKHYVSIWLVSDYASGEARIMEPNKSDGLEWCTFTTLPAPLAPWWNQLFKSEFFESLKKLTN